MDPTTAYIKNRFIEYFSDNPEITVWKLAQTAGVSERTIRRYLNPEDSSIGDIVMLYKVAVAFDISLDILFFPDEFPKLRPSRSDSNALRYSIQEKLALLWTDEEMNVIHCTDTFAALYDTTPQAMCGTNMFQDWTFYGQDNYQWLSESVSDTRKPQLETLVAVTLEEGSGSHQAFFLSPDGTLTRVLMRCFHLKPGFLFLDIPLDDPSFQERGNVTVNSHGQPVLRYESVDMELIDPHVLSGFMSGWDRQKVADQLKVSREQVTESLKRGLLWFGVDDLDALREAAWERVFEHGVVDQYSIIKANGRMLK